MKRPILVLALLALAGSTAESGVVIEMAVSGTGTDDAPLVDTIYAQDAMLRMDPHSARKGQEGTIIFRDETMWVVDHSRKACQKIDREGIEQVGEQLGGAMKQMEQEMAKLPPEQRAMMEKMMKGRMPGAMSGTEAPERRIETGSTEKIGDYTCTVRTLYSGDERVWEICAAEQSDVSGAAEAMEAFRAMASFTETLRESLQQGPFMKMVENPFQDVNEIGGFPVRVRSYLDGRLSSESVLRSITSQEIEEAKFTVPDGYKVQNMADQMRKGR